MLEWLLPTLPSVVPCWSDCYLHYCSRCPVKVIFTYITVRGAVLKWFTYIMWCHARMIVTYITVCGAILKWLLPTSPSAVLCRSVSYLQYRPWSDFIECLLPTSRPSSRLLSAACGVPGPRCYAAVVCYLLLAVLGRSWPLCHAKVLYRLYRTTDASLVNHCPSQPTQIAITREPSPHCGYGYTMKAVGAMSPTRHQLTYNHHVAWSYTRTPVCLLDILS